MYRQHRMAKRPTSKPQPNFQAPTEGIPKKIAPVLSQAGIRTACRGYFGFDNRGRTAFTAWDKHGQPVAVLVKTETVWVLEKRS